LKRTRKQRVRDNKEQEPMLIVVLLWCCGIAGLNGLAFMCKIVGFASGTWQFGLLSFC
jgi:hypothetical protein